MRIVTADAAIDAALLRAYRETEYRVLAPFAAVLRIGEECAALAVVHRRYQTTCSAFITACNPRGRMADGATNAQRQEALLEEIVRRGLAGIPGVGQHPTGDWPGESSYLVPGLGREAARDLGRQFEQNAIVWAGAQAVPELVLCYLGSL